MLLALVALGGTLALWGFWIEPQRLVIREATITLPSWSPAFDGIRVAAIGDLHVGAPHVDLDRLVRIVETVNAQQPDLVLLAGDYLIDNVWGGRFVPAVQVVPVLARLEAPLGAFAVLGNHDRWHGKEAGSIAAFAASGIPLLEDDAVRLARGSATLWLVGLRDIFSAFPDVPATLAKLSDGAPAIAFTHSPDVFPDLPPRIGLLVAAHTHCGQANLPFVGRPIVPSRFRQRYACGYVREGDKQLFVTGGIGTSIIPARFNVPPEIAVLTLRGQGL